MMVNNQDEILQMTSLAMPLAECVRNIIENKTILDRSMISTRTTVDRGGSVSISEFSREKILKKVNLKNPKIVCNNIGCSSWHSVSNGTLEKIYNNCGQISIGDGFCSSCGCDCSYHLEIDYKLQITTVQVEDQTIKEIIATEMDKEKAVTKILERKLGQIESLLDDLTDVLMYSAKVQTYRLFHQKSTKDQFYLHLKNLSKEEKQNDDKYNGDHLQQALEIYEIMVISMNQKVMEKKHPGPTREELRKYLTDLGNLATFRDFIGDIIDRLGETDYMSTASSTSSSSSWVILSQSDFGSGQTLPSGPTEEMQSIPSDLPSQNENFPRYCFDSFQKVDIRSMRRGAQANVYFRTHSEIDGLVAVKIIHDDFVDTKYTKRELNIVKTLPSHEGLLKAYGYVFRNHQPEVNCGYAMPPVDLTLHEVIHKKDGNSLKYTYSLAQALRWLISIATTCDHVHRNKIIHRDLKPKNILVMWSDSKKSIFVSDFGMAKNLEESGTVTSRVGTKHYMAPEVQLGWYEWKADVYSLGIISRELLYRKPVEYIVTLTPKHIPNPEVPKEILDIISSCLQHDATKRPTMEGLKTELEDLLRLHPEWENDNVCELISYEQNGESSIVDH